MPWAVMLKNISGRPKVSKVVESIVSHKPPARSNSGCAFIWMAVMEAFDLGVITGTPFSRG